MTGSKSASVALPVSLNGVRVGIRTSAGALATGGWLPLSTIVDPWFWTGPPATISPTNPVVPEVSLRASGATGRLVSVPPKVTWNPSSLGSPTPPKPTTVSVPPAICSIASSMEPAS